MTIAVGTAVALGAAAAYAAEQWDKAQVSSQRAISGAGARTGTSVGDLNQFAKSNSSAFGLSYDDARTLGEGLTRTGGIVVGQLHNMNDAVVGFANQAGKSVSDVIKDFEKFGSDPVKALDALEEQFGKVEEHTRDLVQYQSLALDKTTAFNTVIDAFSKSLKEAAENTTLLEKGQRLLATAYGAPKGPKPTGPEEQLTAVDKQIAQGGFTPTNQLQDQRADLLNKISADSVKQITAEVNALNSTEGRAAEQTAAIAKSWGDVSVAVALSLNALQQQVTIAQAINGQQQMAAQFAADRANAELAGKTALEAETIAYAKMAASQASATTAVKKQVESLEDQNKMIKAAQTGTEAKTAAAIAYKNAIESGASEESASALRAQMITNSIQQSLQATIDWRAAMIGVGSAVEVVGANLSQVLSQQNAIDAATAQYNAQLVAAQGGSQFNPMTMKRGDLSFTADVTQTGGASYRGGGTGQRLSVTGMYDNLVRQMQGDIGTSVNRALTTGGVDSAIRLAQQKGNIAATTDQYLKGNLISAAQPAFDATGALQNLYGIKNANADDATKITNDQQFLGWLQSQPQTLTNLQAISSLTSEIKSLATATDSNTSATSTNTDALSPYYTQDPRTSHIGFRSQGMATGGEFTVPGGYSANDNMIGTIPLASGEIVSVRRPGDSSGGGGQTVIINQSFNITGNVNRDEFGRTAYQAAQSAARTLQAASR